MTLGSVYYSNGYATMYGSCAQQLFRPCLRSTAKMRRIQWLLTQCIDASNYIPTKEQIAGTVHVGLGESTTGKMCEAESSLQANFKQGKGLDSLCAALQFGARPGHVASQAGILVGHCHASFSLLFSRYDAKPWYNITSHGLRSVCVG